METVMEDQHNYYKMQKLCEEKGVKPDSPAMHMVFTGNPGTAKTTAARLFARIMKNNGLLSRGTACGSWTWRSGWKICSLDSTNRTGKV